MAEQTWCWGWSNWKAKGDKTCIIFSWDVMGESSFATAA